MVLLCHPLKNQILPCFVNFIETHWFDLSLCIRESERKSKTLKSPGFPPQILESVRDKILDFEKNSNVLTLPGRVTIRSSLFGFLFEIVFSGF